MTKKKLTTLFLSVLMIIGALSGISPVTEVEAEGQAYLTSDATINKMFSNLNILTDGYAGLKSVTVDGITWEVFCADPDVLTYVGAEYELQKYPDFYSLPAEMQAAGKVLLNWYTNYNGGIMQGSSAEYYAVQLAIWGTQKGVDPSALIPIDPNNATAIKIRDFASVLYNASWSYPTETVSYNGANKTYDYSNMTGTQVLYKFHGSEQYYFRSELLGVTVNGLTEHLHYNVSLSDNSLGIKITDSHNNETNEFGYGTNHGTGFYIYTPIDRLEEAKTVTVNITNVQYAKLGIALWTGTAQRLINRYAYLGEHAGFTTTVKLPVGEAPAPEPGTVVGEICIIKTGNQPNTVATSSEGDETLYSIAWAEKPLSKAFFGAYKMINGQASNILPNDDAVMTGHDGAICYKNIPISNNENTLIRIAENRVPKGFIAKEQSTTGKYDDGTIFQDFNFDPATAVDGVVKKNDFTFLNNPKHLSIEITKTDSSNNSPLQGAKFGLFSTEEITTYDGTIIPANSLLEVGTTGADGKLTFGSSVPVNQNYLVVELEAPKGYAKMLGAETIDTSAFMADKEETHTYTLNLTNDKNVIEIGTSATFEDGTKKAEISETVTIVDKVTHSGLDEGSRYKLKGILMNKATGEPFEVSGQPVTAEKEFTAEEGVDVEMTFTFSGAALSSGIDLVVYEELYTIDDPDTPIADHKEINDPGQTVTLTEAIKIGTSAKNKDTGEKVIVNLPSVTIVDTVTYSGLEVGQEYTLKGELYNKAKENLFTINGEKVRAEKSFTPTASSGTVDVEFTFDASSLTEEDVLVVYEELYLGTDIVADHKNPNDEAQTVTIKELKIGTIANVNGKKEATLGEIITISDKVTYQGLTVGTEYQLKGCVVDAEGNVIKVNGVDVCTTTDLIPTSEDGEKIVDIELDTSNLEAGNVVIFEELLLDGEVIADHKDLTDTDQTITLKKDIIGKILITKYDSTDVDNKKVMEGVKFILTSTDETVAKQGFTDKDGVVLFDNLDITKEYHIEEVVPSGYVLITDIKNVTFDESKENKGVIEVILDVENEKVVEKGAILVIKSDKDTGTLLKGAEFALMNDETGEEIARKSTDDKGEVLFEDLPVGTYRLKETVIPTGYMIEGSGTWRITLRVVNEPYEVKLTNVKYKATIEITKHDYNEQSKAVKGAHYGLYDLETKKLVEEKETNAEGKILFDNHGEGFEFGSAYFVKETKAAQGYELDTAQYDFIINDSSTNNRKISKLTKTVYDKPIPSEQFGKLKIVKVDKDDANKFLPDATFALYAGTDTSYSKPLQTVKTGADGTVTIEKLAFGDYFVKETAAPSGYVINTSAFKVRITNSAVVNPLELRVTNQKTTNPNGSLTIQKYIENTTTPLSGAGFTLYKFVLYDDATTNAANGACSAHGGVDCSKVDEDGSVYCMDGTKDSSVKWQSVAKCENTTADKYKDGTLVEKQSVKHEKLSANGQVVATGVTDGNGKLTFTNLAPGKYVLEETKVPTGYTAKTPRSTIDLSKKGAGFNEVVTIYNTPGSTVPNTGELGRNPWFYAGILGIGLIAVCGVIYSKKKNDKHSQ